MYHMSEEAERLETIEIRVQKNNRIFFRTTLSSSLICFMSTIVIEFIHYGQ